MTSTVHLSLPLLAAAQAQKHVTHNEALLTLDALAQLSVLSRKTALPAAAAEGARYIAPVGAPGADRVAQWRDGGWTTFTPRAGWRAWVEDEARAVVFDGQAWIVEPSGSTLGDTVSRLGVNTQPSDVNRLAVRAQAVLFSHDAESGGAGSTRLVVNKAAVGQVASLLFQDAYAGRAEIGLCGDDKLRVKTSADGATWVDSMVVDPLANSVSFPGSKFGEVKTVVYLSGSGTYTPPSGCRAIEVTCVGGGGGGAGAQTTVSTSFCAAGGGGGGGAVIKSVANPSGGFSYSVGAGGAGGSGTSPLAEGGASGGNGGATTFSGQGVALTAGGGGGAYSRTETNATKEFSGGNAGTASGGDVNIQGKKGEGVVVIGGNNQINTGIGGGSALGFGGAFANGNGSPGTGFGGGGAGAGMLPGYVLLRSGGAGSPGVVIITEYY